MVKKLLILLSLLAAVPLWAGFGALARPARPVSDLRCARDASDVVLSWATTPPGTYRTLVCRGVLQPRFRAEVIVAVLPPGVTAWRDYGAITRTRLGVSVNEFYCVYALPGAVTPPPLQRVAARPEYFEVPRNRSQLILFEPPNGGQFVTAPVLAAPGRDNNWKLPAARSSATAFLFDTENFPTPGGLVGAEALASAEPAEGRPTTWLHTGYYAGALYFPVAGDQTMTAAIVREISAPAVSRAGQVCTVTCAAPPQDAAGTIISIQWYRSYLGVGDAETLIPMGTTAPSVLEITDDITAVPADWYVFYTYRLLYAAGSSNCSRSSAPVRR